MTDSQIDCFLSVAKHLSFSKASAQMYKSQPSVSKQIALLEQELELSLFERSNREVQLTSAGLLLYDHLSNYRRELAETITAAKKVQGGKHKILKIGCLEGWMSDVFYTHLRKLYPLRITQTRIQIKALGFRHLANALSNGELDIIITLEGSLESDPDFTIKKLAKIQRVVCFSAHHHLAGKTDLTLRDFRDDSFYMLSEEEISSSKFKVRDTCDPYGFTPRIVVVPNIETKIMEMQTGHGVAFFDEWSRELHNSLFRWIPIDSFHTVGIAWNNSISNPVRDDICMEIINYLSKYKESMSID